MTGTQTLRGRLANGAGWVLERPEDWNGVLCLFSHGYGEFGPDGPADPAGSPLVRQWLLDHGYALAASTYAAQGWAIADAVRDQVATLTEFRSRIGTPDITVAWGRSMGGLVTAAFAQLAPETIDAAVPMCASVAGPIPMLNQGLDGAFVLSTLIPGGERVRLVGAGQDDRERWEIGARLVRSALEDPLGRARFALAAAVAQMPTWTDGDLEGVTEPAPEPEPGDWRAALANQAKVFHYAAFSPRLSLEARAGGNFSWNSGVDYAEQLRVSGLSWIVEAAYADAGTTPDADLARLAEAPRIAADPAAVAAMERDLTPDGGIGVPVLTVSLTGDYAPTVTQTAAYRDVVAAAGNDALLRQSFVRGPGHCAFRTAEIVASIQAAEDRVRDGAWSGVDADGMNARVAALTAGAARHPEPRFTPHDPLPHVRPYPRDARLTPLSNPNRSIR